MHVSKGDTVRVMRGDDKGKEGKVMRIYPKTGRVLDRRNQHREEAPQGADGRRAERNHRGRRLRCIRRISCFSMPKTGEPTRTKARIDTDGTKERVGVRSGKPIPRDSLTGDR